MDTQWSRYQVFAQEKPGAPHMDVGSVHATDAELALLNARDVFARRPESVSMWVVPVDAILWKTSQELSSEEDNSGSEVDIQPPNKTRQSYVVFCKLKQAGTHQFAANVTAASPLEAIMQVKQGLAQRSHVLSWCVFPETIATRSKPNDVDSLYAPAREKTYRMSTDFHTVSAMRAIKTPGGDGDE